MKKRIAAFAIAVITVLSLLPVAPVADAGADTTPPELVDISFNGTSFNRGDTLTVTVHATDLESGLSSESYIEIDITRTVDYGIEYESYRINLFLADANTLQGSIVLDKMEGGEYCLNGLYLKDNAGNVKTFYEADLPQISFNLTSDFILKNVLEAASFSASSAKVGNTINITATVKNVNSSIGKLVMRFFCPGDVWARDYYIDLQRVQGTADKFSGSFVVPAGIAAGDYYGEFFLDVSGRRYLIRENQSIRPIINIINPSYVKPVKSPEFLSYQLSTHQIVDGQSFIVTVKVDPKYNYFEYFTADFGIIDDFYTRITVRLDKIGDGVYSGTYDTGYTTVKTGEYYLPSWFIGWIDYDNIIIFNAGPSEKTFNVGYSKYLTNSNLTILPAISFTGTENKTILVGEQFDPMQGVKITNRLTGEDVTSKATVTGSVNTNAPGLYLLRYYVNDQYYHNSETYESKSATQTDYRWIGVSEIMPQGKAANGSVPQAVSYGNLSFGTAGNEVSLEKDGKSIPFASAVTAPGTYELSAAGSGANAKLTLFAAAAPGGEGVTSATAVIDKAGPEITATWNRLVTGEMDVKVNANDVSGVAELKYLIGTKTVAECRNSGTAFTGGFKMPAQGPCTVYAKDKGGFESVKVFQVTEPLIKTMYLSQVSLSAGSLSRAFSKTVYKYTVNLGEHQGSVTITPYKENYEAIIKINNVSVNSVTVNVANGKSVSKSIRVYYGKSYKTYTFKVTRAKSTNNLLSSLTASAGTFNKPFDPNVTNYVLTLDENTSRVKLYSKAAGPGARATFTSRSYSLKNAQSRVVTLKVKSQAGVYRTYTITIVRKPSSNANLKRLKTNSSRYFVLTPAFNPAVTEYKITMPANKSSMTLSYSLAGYKATALIDGVRRTSKKITLPNGGSATVTITVTAQSGTVKKYVIHIYRGKLPVPPSNGTTS